MAAIYIRRGFGSSATAALAASCMALLFLPGCKQMQLPSQHAGEQTAVQAKERTPQPKKPAEQRAPASAKPAQDAAKAQPKNNPQDMKTAAIQAGSEVKASVKEIQATLSGDDSLVADTDMVNINYATSEKLQTLPGVNAATAKTIMDNRPYNTPLDLVYKKVITKAEYQRIVNRAVTWDNLWTKSD